MIQKRTASRFNANKASTAQIIIIRREVRAMRPAITAMTKTTTLTLRPTMCSAEKEGMRNIAYWEDLTPYSKVTLT